MQGQMQLLIIHLLSHWMTSQSSTVDGGWVGGVEFHKYRFCTSMPFATSFNVCFLQGALRNLQKTRQWCINSKYVYVHKGILTFIFFLYIVYNLYCIASWTETKKYTLGFYALLTQNENLLQNKGKNKNYNPNITPYKIKWWKSPFTTVTCKSKEDHECPLSAISEASLQNLKSLEQLHATPSSYLEVLKGKTRGWLLVQRLHLQLWKLPETSRFLFYVCFSW